LTKALGFIRNKDLKIGAEKSSEVKEPRFHEIFMKTKRQGFF